LKKVRRRKHLRVIEEGEEEEAFEGH